MKNLPLCLITLLCACSNSATSLLQSSSEVVIIFKDAPDQSFAKRYGFSIVPRTVVDYVDLDLRLKHFNPKLIGYDTLVIPTFDGYAEVIHRFQAVEENYYLLQAGDTVTFTYTDNLRPQINSLCSKESSWLYNIPEHDSRTIHQETGYTLKTLCTDNFFVSRWNTLNSPKYKNDKAKQEFVKQQLAKYPNIDSLKLIYDEYQIEYAKYIDSLVSNGCISSLYADFYRDNSRVREDVLHCDSLLRYPSSHAAIAGEIVEKSVEEVVEFGRDTTISKYARISVLESRLQNDKELHWGNDPKVIAACAEMFEQLTGSSFYTTEEPTVKITADAGSMIIEDLEGAQVTFDQLLQQHRGKMVYVDLWASWCAPCVAAMKDAEKLRQECEGKGVAFVYLAVRDKVEAWRAAIEKYNINTYGAKNYFVVNSDQCTYLKEVDNRTIPQYILYSAKGEIINHKAPSPASDEIMEIFGI